MDNLSSGAGDGQRLDEEMSSNEGSSDGEGDDDIFDDFDVRDGRLVISEVSVDHEECLMVFYTIFFFSFSLMTP